MSGFEPLLVKFGEEEKVIDGSLVMRVAAEVENFIPYGSMSVLLNPQHFNFALVSSAYMVLLRYAGIKSTEKEVLQKLSSGEVSKDAASSILGLFAQYRPVEVDEKTTKKKPVRRSKKASE